MNLKASLGCSLKHECEKPDGMTVSLLWEMEGNTRSLKLSDMPRLVSISPLISVSSKLVLRFWEMEATLSIPCLRSDAQFSFCI